MYILFGDFAILQISHKFVFNIMFEVNILIVKFKLYFDYQIITQVNCREFAFRITQMPTANCMLQMVCVNIALSLEL